MDNLKFAAAWEKFSAVGKIGPRSQTQPLPRSPHPRLFLPPLPARQRRSKTSLALNRLRIRHVQQLLRWSPRADGARRHANSTTALKAMKGAIQDAARWLRRTTPNTVCITMQVIIIQSAFALRGPLLQFDLCKADHLHFLRQESDACTDLQLSGSL